MYVNKEQGAGSVEYLEGAELGVDAVQGHQLRVGAELRDPLVGHYGNAVGVLDGGEAVRDHHGGVLVDLVQPVQGLLDHLVYGGYVNEEGRRGVL